MLPRSSMRVPVLRVEKITRNSRGKAKVKTAPAGLRQNAFCSNLSWRAAMERSVMGGGRLGGEGQVDVLQAGSGDAQAVQGDAPFEGPPGERVEHGCGLGGANDHAPRV